MDDQKNKKVYQGVIEYINNMIVGGGLGKGDKLPTERELAKRLEVSRNSIREALKTLDVIGLVERRQGDGTYIKESFDDCLAEPLSIMFMLEKVSGYDILELRNMIEVETAALAAKRITNEEITQLTEAYNKMMNEKNEEISTKYDKQFHYIIAKSTKNIIIINYFNVTSFLYDSFIKDIREKVAKEIDKNLANKIHMDIHQALVNRDPKGASEAMRKHMDVINSLYPDLNKSKRIFKTFLDI